ncbi:MAG: tyrosine-type recombinase/integrase [Lachnospiraceae bacterium]|nr:tyrosine-type recombinase/integrase [Lachnospiraceae bacterium]
MGKENFAAEFVAKLDGKLAAEDLRTVLEELQLFTADYDISQRVTDLTAYQGGIPECYQTYLVTKKIEGLSLGTLKTYDDCLRDFFENTRKPLGEMSTNDIRVYLYNAQRRNGITNRTMDNKRLIIHAFFGWCVSEGYLLQNPCDRIRPIKYEAKPREPLNGIELELVRDACRNYREKAIVETLYSTGCRVSESIILKKSDVDFQTKEVHLFGKGSKHRTSYINARAEVAIRKYLLSRSDDCDALFVTVRKPYRPLSKGAMEKIVHDIGIRSAIGRPLYPHLIRHTTATDALSRGMNVAELQKILGHEKLDTTMIYAEIQQDDVKYSHKKCIV